MGVGDYIHSKEGGQPRGADKPAQSRQQRAEMARVEVPPTQLVGPGAGATDGRGAPSGFPVPKFPHHPRSLSAQPLHPQQPPQGQWDRGAFDTDVEEIDDSTVAGTSVYGAEENKPQAASNTTAPYANGDPQPMHQPRPARQTYGSQWYEPLGNQAMNKTAFDSDELEDFGSQLTSSLGGDGGDDEKPNEPAGWSHKPRMSEEPLSKRLEKFWSSTRKRTSSPQPIVINSDPEPPAEPQAKPKPRKLGQMLPTGPRKVVLPQNTSSTPRTRFSPPKPSLLEQLDKKLEKSPTRHPQPAPELTQSPNMSYFPEHIDSDGGSDDGMEPTIRANDRREVSRSTNAFDMTSLTDLDVDDTIHDPFFAHDLNDSHQAQEPHEPYEIHEMPEHEAHSAQPSTRSRRNTIIHNKKRPLEADYPPEVLYQKSFSELQAEPFEKAPTPPPVKSPSLPPKPAFIPDTNEPKNAVSNLLTLAGEERQNYLSQMSLHEWEDCGDQIIDRFTHLLSEMRNLRHARRHTAAVFEGEVKRRHDEVESQNLELTNKLTDMRSGGAEVLRGRYP
ncbi:unnamed protein product [Penicillium salamii]|uniref:Extracellular mutant protein 11 C-terminal domain-containing protein n=1 Tax=Penicillium salamii TaxID=1612424 RepID=A0A9W4JM75_9EURO|nr:unnamed protein product [Penicillium salamii]CAG8105218.1 unnamed protein product [Penicillium salamii]CAG8139335.1 unnamed protein product [Penicillium salamii]CAG8143118.1 unnamed protein product [Penicillium salamii]CAG8178356.1 unnamed protein product [Penicillium salamii]